LQLRQIIDSELTERQRLALMAVYFDNRSITEVAEVMEMSPNALYKLLHDARKKIKQQLQRQRYSAGDILALFEEDW
jgi:RNA polymerase sigma-70 factor (ECF subfamily)